MEARVTAEMRVAADKIRLRGPQTTNRIRRNSRDEAERILQEARYYAQNMDGDEEREQSVLASYIESELIKRYDKGVFSLAESAACPLMWSHYGDQHKGICIGHSVPNSVAQNLCKIEYGGDRLVKASAVRAMLAGDDGAGEIIDKAIFGRKAVQWNYEREWRLLGPRGLQNSDIDLVEVVFGMRCPSAVKYAIIRALSDRSKPVEFFEIQNIYGEFGLEKREVDDGEMMIHFPRRFRDIYDIFKDIPDMLS